MISLPDRRLKIVFDKLTKRISEKQTLSLRKLSSSRKEEIQFGRFIGNKRVSMDFLEQELYSQIGNHGDSKHCLLIEDTSQVGFSLERSIKDLGKVDKGQIKGFYIHPVLAIDAVNYACYGVAAVEFISRPWPQQQLTHNQISRARDKAPFEEKESYRWLDGVKKALPRCLNIPFKTVIADREADIYPLLTGLTDELAVDYIIRSRIDRGTESGTRISEQVKDWSEASCCQIKVPATDKRSAHTAKMVVKYGKVSLRKTESKSMRKLPPYHSTYVVEVKELPESIVNNEEPIQWLLLTSHRIDDPEKALQIIDWYKQRWNVEQVFRTLKSRGLRINSSQLEDYEKLKKMTVLALISAIKVIQLIKAREGQTGQLMSATFNETEGQCMVLLNRQLEGNTEKLKNPFSRDTLAFAAWVIARLAGWSGYQSQRPAGPIDFLIGLQRFDERVKGYILAKEHT